YRDSLARVSAARGSVPFSSSFSRTLALKAVSDASAHDCPRATALLATLDGKGRESLRILAAFSTCCLLADVPVRLRVMPPSRASVATSSHVQLLPAGSDTAVCILLMLSDRLPE